MDNYKFIKRNEVFKGKIIEVVQDTILMPHGKEVIREIIIHNGASAIIPIDNDGNIIFVRQYRHPALEHILEIPAGTLEKDEDPYDCAERELEEETGFKASKIEFLTKMYSAVGFCTEMLHIYIAEGLYEGKQNLDEDEFVAIEKYSLDESVEMIFNGKIKDSKTMVAILAYKELLSKNK